MIKFDNLDTWGWEHAIRGMRNSMNSWDNSDSNFKNIDIFLGENDKKLMKLLVAHGSSHRKFMRQIFISIDITAPIYWWKEFDTYKIGTVSNSCSTMHTLNSKPLTRDDFSTEHLIALDVETTDGIKKKLDFKELLDADIIMINYAMNLYNKTHDEDYWWQMIQMLPESYNQKRTITMNYENIRNIVEQRYNHKLDEWRTFVRWALTELPESWLFTVNNEQSRTQAQAEK